MKEKESGVMSGYVKGRQIERENECKVEKWVDPHEVHMDVRGKEL